MASRAHCLPVVLAPRLPLPNPSHIFSSTRTLLSSVRKSRCRVLSFQSPVEKIGTQLSVGGILGFATGYAIRRIGQLLILVIGVEILALQMMARQQWVDVKWKKIGRDLSPHVEKDAVQRLVDGVAFKIPFAASFTGGIYAGLRWK